MNTGQLTDHIEVQSRLTPYRVEVYRESLPIEALGAGELALEASEYTELGFETLARQYTRLAEGPHIGRRLNAAELKVWAWRYPTIYTTGDFERVRIGTVRRTWKELQWPVPPEVRQLIPAARRAYDSLQIWVPELHAAPPPTALSPILIGVRGNERWLLARWAEALEPFEEIRARAMSPAGRRALAIRRRLGADRFAPILLAGLLGSGVALFAVAACSIAVGIAGHPPRPDCAVPWAIASVSALIGVGFAVREACLRSGRALQWACEYAGWVDMSPRGGEF